MSASHVHHAMGATGTMKSYWSGRVELWTPAHVNFGKDRGSEAAFKATRHCANALHNHSAVCNKP